ncbi:amphi-Trp domain-containing protein [Phaeobacter sp. B1627]|uniref:amphi-Trp domain-containing protein n=1 Tax=Phaeobacter sp. B1627 TaxID=2583809 RepID=UPI001117D976|nr:amphi-Trp domain-containing protein [Phaeobacter sp. B1627]TNJ43023.1 amphi-Trp domain-containing protein [Phaeobacter sp. B1627]
MAKDDKARDDARFRHDSLQDRKTVKTLIDAIGKGLAKGELSLSDDDNEILLTPEGLLTLRIRAERNDGQCKVDFRVSWTERDDDLRERAAPKVKPRS